MVKMRYFLILSYFIIGCPIFNGHHEKSNCIYLLSGEFRCTVHDPRGTRYQNLFRLSDSYCQKAGLPCEANSTVKPAITSIKASSEVKLCFDSVWSTDSSIQKCLDLLE